jgi:hypothetical protein
MDLEQREAALRLTYAKSLAQAAFQSRQVRERSDVVSTSPGDSVMGSLMLRVRTHRPCRAVITWLPDGCAGGPASVGTNKAFGAAGREALGP